MAARGDREANRPYRAYLLNEKLRAVVAAKRGERGSQLLTDRIAYAGGHS